MTAALNRSTTPTAAPTAVPPFTTAARQARRRVNRMAMLTAVVLANVLSPLATPAAHAHAEVVSITPVDGSELRKAPGTVSVSFNEAVGAVRSAVELLDAKGKVVARNGTAQNSSTITVSTPKLRNGRYVLRWAVTSADGHPVVAASSFTVGTPTLPARPQPLTLSGPDGSTDGRLDGARVGRRDITFLGMAGEGVLELRHGTFKAPIIWKLRPKGGDLIARGVLPAAGTWQLTLKVRTGPFEQLTRSTTVRVSP